MPTSQKEKVEPYLLTPEAKSFQSRFRKMLGVGKLLQAGIVSEAATMNQLKTTYGLYQEELSKMIQNAPSKKVNELGQQVSAQEEPDLFNQFFEGTRITY